MSVSKNDQIRGIFQPITLYFTAATSGDVMEYPKNRDKVPSYYIGGTHGYVYNTAYIAFLLISEN